MSNIDSSSATAVVKTLYTLYMIAALSGTTLFKRYKVEIYSKFSNQVPLLSHSPELKFIYEASIAASRIDAKAVYMIAKSEKAIIECHSLAMVCECLFQVSRMPHMMFKIFSVI